MNRAAIQARNDSASSGKATADQLAIMQRQLNKFGEQAKAAQESVAAIQQQTQTISDNARLEQRPWVGIQETVGGPIVSDGYVSPETTIQVQNTGKTPALELNGKYVQVVTERDAPVPDYEDIENGKFTGNRVFSFLFSPGDVLAPEASRKLHVGHTRYRSRTVQEGLPRAFYIVGKITYKDSVGGPLHTTKFCLFNVERYEPVAFLSCPAGNSMD
jgi:hypothetical protein